MTDQIDVSWLVERATAALDGVTPGPWVAVRASHGPVDVFSGDRDIVTFYGTNHENDARFTAAAHPQGSEAVQGGGQSR